MFPKVLKETADQFAEEAIVQIKGRYDSNDRGAQILLSNIKALAFGKQVTIEMEKSKVDRETLAEIDRTIRQYPGMDKICFALFDGGVAKSRAELNVMVDSGNILMLSTLSSLLNGKGRLIV